jgi:predicted RNA-binding protein YlxR (DUF448 family)
LVLDGEGQLLVDGMKTFPGRGVYLCPSRGCFELARKKKGLSRGFRGRQSQGIPEGVVSVFQEEEGWQK